MDLEIARLRTRSQERVRRAGPRFSVVRIALVIAVFGVFASACSQSPSGGGSSSGGSASASPLALARCMRAHGVHDFPDPDASGNFGLSGEGDLTPSNPTFEAAAEACRSLGSATKGAAPSLSPSQIAATLAFAQCMRSHGIANYPDPNSSGQIPGIRHFGVDPNSPQFQSASESCGHYMQGVPGWP